MAMAKRKITLFSGKGDEALATWDPETKEGCEEARLVFDKEKKNGAHLIKNLGCPDEGPIVDFDPYAPDVNEVTVIRPMAGG